MMLTKCATHTVPNMFFRKHILNWVITEVLLVPSSATAKQENSCRLYLAPCGTPHSKTEEGRRFGISLYFEFCKSCCMALYRLGDFSINRVQLHCTNHTILLEKKKKG